MMTPEENDLLCRVEGDAPMGQIMRRHWIAACLSEEVAEPDGAPVKVRLLGEDLVVFRDSKGRIGVLDEYCSHRRASLVFARNEECGLRCLYHGWKFDVDGNVVEMASEPDAQPHPRPRQAQGLSGARGRRLRVDLYGAAGGDARIRSAGLRADAGRARQRHQGAGALQLGADPRRADRFGALLQSAFLRHGAGAGRRRQGDGSELAAAVDRQGAALPDRAHQLRLPLRGDPAPDHERSDARLHPHHGLYRAVHRADPAEQRAQCRDAADAGRRSQHHLLFHRLERRRQAGHRRRGVAQVQRAAMGRRRRSQFRRHAHSATISTVRTAPR